MPAEMTWAIVIACCAGVLLGATAVLALRRRKAPQPVCEPARQEARRFFLLNETGHVLISTSVGTSERLPDATLELFSEAVSHLALVLFAIAKGKDPATGERFSLYDYGVLERALNRHPVFIRVAGDAAPSSERPAGDRPASLASARKEGVNEASADATWLEARVNVSSRSLGVDDSPPIRRKLRVIHAHMRAEATRLAASRHTLRAEAAALTAAPGTPRPSGADHAEVGFIMLYCEYLMGVSIVSVKLTHARWQDYLSSDTPTMETDTYLFVSPSQLKRASADVLGLPRVNVVA